MFYHLAQYTTPGRTRASPSLRPDPKRETDRMNGRGKRKLTDEQERQRKEGLRILARIIARHYLANPHLYRERAAGDESGKPLKEGGA